MPEPEVEEVDAASQEEALFSRIALSANPRKVEYLGNRACGFSIREACNLSNISLSTLHKWRREDPKFAEFESNNLYELQKNVGPDIIRLGFLRCVKLFLKIDFRVLYRASLLGLDIATMSADEAYGKGISNREFTYICKIRSEYGPAAMLAFHKALEPESVKDDRGMFQQVVVVVDGKMLEGEAARAAAGKTLLKQFSANRKMLPEGEENGGDGDQG